MIAGVRDARRLSPEAQEDLRRRVVAAVHGGMSQAEAAQVFAVAPQSVSRWVQGNRARRVLPRVAGVASQASRKR
ncbi:helix-turn-helix domain-containing protein [Saccharopolyspora shandongensis]|uniref:helix-turn-helix domain-containing protein n=1 Tax=Saccharopolyspora shandongensis TaxID=418495 RepID=UPI0034444FE8